MPALPDHRFLWDTRAAPLMPDAPAEQILTAAARLADEVLGPLNRAGDRQPARLEAGRVIAPPGFAAGHRAIADGGFIGMAASPDHGGLGLPMALTAMVNETFAGACMALSMAPLMTQGQIEALVAHADPALRDRVVPRLIAGDWTGTMNLTEPQAGSDVGALTTRAEPAADGSFRITGQKIYITWADNDFAENISHLVLARLPGAPAGTRGISLFLVPRVIDGQQNALRVVSLEHKLGLHGSPTAVMAYEGATGWIVGAPGGGMAAMFTMMNNARLGVGMQGIGVAEAALRMATAHAADRRQGGRAIIDWPDVRRMLATARAQVFAARAIAIDCAIATDMVARTGDAAWAARAGVLTPVAKAFGTDTGVEVTAAAIQVFGGMGVIEETGIAQLARDVRVTTIYEGTNGIQALDLAGRKLADGGAALRTALDAPQADAAIDWMAAAGPDDRQAGAVPFLRAMALMLGAQAHDRAAAADPARAPLAAVFRQRLLPQAGPLLDEATGSAAVIMAADLAS